MPRLDDGQLATSVNKFKKRRAWLLADDAEAIPSAAKKSAQEPAIILPSSTTYFAPEDMGKLEHDQNKSKTRIEHDSNKTKTRVKHELNKNETRVKQETATHHDNIVDHTIKLEQGLNKSETRLKHDYNKSETRAEHDQNKTKTRVKHELNKNETRVKQETATHHDNIVDHTIKLEQGLNKSETRLKHDYNKSETRAEHDQNMSGTRVKHEWNKSETSRLDLFFAFIVHHKAELTAFDDDDRWLLLSLSDVQKRMFWHVANTCIARGTQRTGPIEIKGFFSPLGISTDVVRTSLNRMIEKGILQREKGKLGKNGFAIISLPRTIHDLAKELITNFNNTQTT